MLHLPISRLLAVLAPLLALGFVAGALRGLAQRPDLAPARRRGLTAAWVLVLLVGAPAWLVLAAALHMW